MDSFFGFFVVFARDPVDFSEVHALGFAGGSFFGCFVGVGRLLVDFSRVFSGGSTMSTDEQAEEVSVSTV